MSLEAYQYVLCRMVASSVYRSDVQTRPDESLAGLPLTDLERRRLLAVANQPGMRVNTAIHRANRLASVAQTMPFTCFLISTCMKDVFDRYWDANPTESLQLPVECERFGRFLETEIDSGRIDDPYLEEISRFERVCTKLRFYSGRELAEQGLPGELLAVVRFRHDPVALLEALAEFRVPVGLATGEFHLAIDFRSGEAEFLLLDASGVEALREYAALG